MRRLRESRRLRRSCAAWSLLGLVCTEALACLVAWQQSAGTVPVAAAAAAVWWALIAVVFVGGASLLLTPDGRPVDVYGVPNGLTALRAWLCMPLFLCASLNLPGRLGIALWAGIGGPVGLFDAVDGLVARRFSRITVLGKALDPLMDALFFIAAGIGSYLLGIMPLWLAAFIAFRYGAPLLGTPVVLLARRRPELVHTVWGRRNTLLTGVVLFVLLFTKLFGGPVDVVAPAVALPLLVPTLVLHFIALARRTAEAPVAG